MDFILGNRACNKAPSVRILAFTSTDHSIRIVRPSFLFYSFFFCFFIHTPAFTQTASEKVSVLASASVQSNPAQITLNWGAVFNSVGYNIYRRDKGSSGWKVLLNPTLITGTTYTDNTVVTGTSYEYKILSYQNSFPYVAYGYVNAGINIPLVEDRGGIALVIDTTYANQLASAIDELIWDLRGDGWKVERIDVDRNDAVTAVKAKIVAAYNSNSGLKTVYLLGHVPVPYSGLIAPDGHSNHYGAWPCDGYYGDIDGVWTDYTVNYTASDTRNTNIAGDGKFDQSTYPSSLELQVGRVDFANLSAHSSDEKTLLLEYLDKAHTYKHGGIVSKEQAIVDDNFTTLSEGIAGTAWRGFSPLVGHTKVTSNDYLSSLTSNSYKWSFGCGGGSNTSISGVGNINDFMNNELQSIFTVLMGSYFGDWDQEDNILRMAMTSGTILTSVWAGRPHWYFHNMGLGENIGYSALISENNSNNEFFPVGNAPKSVHMALMGDPSLRMHQAAPVDQLSAIASSTDIDLSWTGTSGLGYHVFRANSAEGPYNRLSSNVLTSPSYTDACVDSGNYYYMVRAIELEESASGSYYNMSQGVFTMVTSTSSCGASLPVELYSFEAQADKNKQVILNWLTETEANTSHFEVERSEDAYQWEKIGSVEAAENSTELLEYQLLDTNPFRIHNYYRLKMVDLDESFEYSQIEYVKLAQLDFKIFPNPTSGNIHISLPTEFMPGEPVTWQLINSSGALIKQKTIPQLNSILHLNVSELPDGIYFLNLESTGQALSKRFVKLPS